MLNREQKERSQSEKPSAAKDRRNCGLHEDILHSRKAVQRKSRQTEHRTGGLFKAAIIWHIYGILSLRRTAEEICLNIVYRWFLGYSLTEKTPHFSTFSYNFSHRFTEEVVQQVEI